MNGTVSQTVHAAVTASKTSARSLNVHCCALEIAKLHGIHGTGIWLVEQALLMVGSRAGVGMKIGNDVPPGRAAEALRAANSN